MRENKIEAEQTVLGSILLNPQCIGKVRKDLSIEDFYLEKHQAIFKTLILIADNGKPLDISVLINELSNNGGLEKAGGKKYLISLAEGISTSAAVEYHIQEVKTAASLRNLQLLLLQSLDGIKDGESFHEVTTDIEDKLQKLKECYKPKSEHYIEADWLLATIYEREISVIGKGILPAGGGLILAGESGTGKSILRTEIAIHLAMGWDLYGLPVNETRKVLLIQSENPEPTEQYRLSQMLKAFQIQSLPNLKFAKPMRFDLKLKKDRAEALALVENSGAQVTIWDPLSSLHEGNENDNIHMRTILDTITEINRKANTSAVVIHHWGKPQEGREEEYRLRGATSIRDWADTVIQMTRKKHKSKILHYLTFTKIRNGPEHRPILLEADKKYFTHNVVEEDTLASPEKVAEALSELGGEVESQAELVKALIEDVGCSEKSAKKYIKNAVYKTIKEFNTKGKQKGYCLYDNQS